MSLSSAMDQRSGRLSRSRRLKRSRLRCSPGGVGGFRFSGVASVFVRLYRFADFLPSPGPRGGGSSSWSAPFLGAECVRRLKRELAGAPGVDGGSSALAAATTAGGISPWLADRARRRPAGAGDGRIVSPRVAWSSPTWDAQSW